MLLLENTIGCPRANNYHYVDLFIIFKGETRHLLLLQNKSSSNLFDQYLKTDHHFILTNPKESTETSTSMLYFKGVKVN
jgi:hypothetical protein